MSEVRACTELIRRLEQKGVVLYPKEDRLAWKAPHGALTAEDRAEISRHRVGLWAEIHQRTWLVRSRSTR